MLNMFICLQLPCIIFTHLYFFLTILFFPFPISNCNWKIAHSFLIFKFQVLSFEIPSKKHSNGLPLCNVLSLYALKMLPDRTFILEAPMIWPNAKTSGNRFLSLSYKHKLTHILKLLFWVTNIFYISFFLKQ